MDVALYTEGTYPHSFGGVSVWCDQLVRGMPDHTFHVVALTATGREVPAWELPANIGSVHTVPLWGPIPSRRSSRAVLRREFETPFGELVESLLNPSDSAHFGLAMRALVEFAGRHSLGAALRSQAAVRVLTAAWQRHERLPGSAHPTLLDALSALELLEHSLRPVGALALDADVSHCVTNGLAVLPALVAKWRHGTPLVLTEHGVYLRERYLETARHAQSFAVRSLVLGFLRQLCALAYQEAEVIAAGNIYNQRWERRLGAQAARLRTVYNGVDPADFPAVDGEPDEPTISWAGRIDPIKDLETLTRAFAVVHSELPAARLRIFGGATAQNAGYLERCRALVSELGLSAAVAFEGRVADIRDAYAAGHVVVLSSVSEGFPYSVIEAMTCGRPCVATDVGGVTEALADTGVVVPPRDPQALGQACLALLQEPARRRRLGAAARTRALEFFTLNRAIDTFDGIYTTIAGRATSPTGQPAGLLWEATA